MCRNFWQFRQLQNDKQHWTSVSTQLRSWHSFGLLGSQYHFGELCWVWLHICNRRKLLVKNGYPGYSQTFWVELPVRIVFLGLMWCARSVSDFRMAELNCNSIHKYPNMPKQLYITRTFPQIPNLQSNSALLAGIRSHRHKLAKLI